MEKNNIFPQCKGTANYVITNEKGAKILGNAIENMEKNDEVKVTAEFATSWKRALNAARKTVGKKRLDKEPSDTWKSWMLLAEHSPIRLVEYDLSFEKIRQWVSVHIIRHFLGLIPFVHSQREDRRQLDCSRDDLPQGSLNDMDIAANAQALINVSRKRLCSKASPETRIAWQRTKDAIAQIDPIMASKMVPNCVYRGFCPEHETCGYAYTEKFKRDLEEYRKECTELHRKQFEEKEKHK